VRNNLFFKEDEFSLSLSAPRLLAPWVVVTWRLCVMLAAVAVVWVLLWAVDAQRGQCSERGRRMDGWRERLMDGEREREAVGLWLHKCERGKEDEALWK